MGARMNSNVKELKSARVGGEKTGPVSLRRPPPDFRSSLFGCEAGLRFPAVKLLDLAAHEAMLEASSNPFAQVVLAHLKARQTHGDPAGRHAWKVRLVRGLYERGFSP